VTSISQEKVVNLLAVEGAAGEAVQMLPSSRLKTRSVHVELIGETRYATFGRKTFSNRFHCTGILTQEEFALYVRSRKW
jgi:hypothetical protein